MVIYHPAYDVHHCSYRLLHLLSSVENYSVSRDALRLMDFYYVYPHLLKSVELPRVLAKFSGAIMNISDPFEFTPNPKGLFFDLSRIQDVALLALQQKMIIEISSGEVVLFSEPLPEFLVSTFQSDNFSHSDFFQGLIEVFPKLKLDGKSGFKSKSGLMEYRYD